MTVSEQIIQVLDNLCEKMGIVVDWTSENVIPYVTMLCEKLVTYEIATSLVRIGFRLLFIIGCIILVKKLRPIYKTNLEKEKETYDCSWATITFVSVLLLIFFFATVTGTIGREIMDVVKCITFPEMYVFEYVSALIPKS